MTKWIVIGLGGVVLIGGGVAGGLYATTLASGKPGGRPSADEPHLIPKADQKRGGGKEGEATGGHKAPLGEGGDKYASNYYALDKEFTSNLQESVHFIQVGIAVSTPYDDRVIENLKTNEIAVRSSILLALGDTTEDEVFTGDGKKRLQARLVKAINETLKQKEGFGGISNVYFTNFVVQ
ncbi:MAG: flagellar basal body-associated FliL family protein [Sphingomonadaceae bacterium]|nr:flagellar basal body-associated FliL family protein [Sphingomonadaceae bacterium]